MPDQDQPAPPSAGAYVPNPAAARPVSRTSEPPEEGDPTDDMPLSGPARGALKVAEWLPDWAGSIRFRLTAIYSLLLFGVAAFMLAGMYGFLASRLHEENVYRTYQVTTVREVPGGVVLTPTEIRASYRTVEALANERALSLLRGYSLCALVVLFFSLSSGKRGVYVLPAVPALVMAAALGAAVPVFWAG